MHACLRAVRWAQHELAFTALARVGGRQPLPCAVQVYVARAPPTAWRGAWLPAGLAALLWRAVLLRELLALAYYWARGWLC